LKNADKQININLKEPKTVFESLIKNDVIKDPFYGLNEDDVTWVFQSDWIYETEFDLSEEFLDASEIILQFEGLDTIAEIYLNGELIDSVKNMFRTYTYKIKSIVKSQSNTLKIIFRSPTKYTLELIEKYEVELKTGEENRAFPGVPYLRKAQYSFGWDWGPILPDIGIWKNVKIIAINKAKIDSVYINQKFDYNPNSNKIESVILDFKITIESYINDLISEEIILLLKLRDPNGTNIIKEILLTSLEEFIKIKIEKPYLWWIHDLGAQNLYELTIELKNEEKIDKYTQRIGLREIKLVKNPDEWGESFYFELNGFPIFAKGANWIPVDSFIPRGKKLGLYEMNLEFAKEANMNMLRVWGGGIYEDDLFYDICDMLGILVWQDFTFACAIYPIHEDFYNDIEIEFKDNIKRLRNHPCLALWCGNNEIEYLWNWLRVRSGINDKELEREYKKSYVKLFEEKLPHILKKLDPNRPYWPSSPSNGFCDMKLGTINSNSPNEGDSHYWSVWHGGKPFKAYRSFNSRFISEFGFESFPSIKTISEFCPKDQFDINSPIMENHQKNEAGNDLIMRYMKRRYSVPEDFKKQVILSQITQAEAIEYGVKYWRSQRSDYRCMGTLYWQLNDCWPVASWSSIDYYGRWKALHYLAKRFYQSIIVDVNANEKKIEFRLINDSLESVDVILVWKILDFNGKLLMKGKINQRLIKLETSKIKPINIKELNQIIDIKKESVIFYELKNENNQKCIYHGYKLFDKPKNFRLKESNFEIQLKDYSEKEFPNYDLIIEIYSENISLFTFLESDLFDFIASENFFVMEPEQSKKIGLKIIAYEEIIEKWTLKEIICSIEVYSLSDLIK